jgi:hypothetical protein
MVEYCALMNKNGKMSPAETIPGVGGGIKENDGGVNSTMRHCKNFYKCHNVPSAQQYDNKQKTKQYSPFYR